MGYNDGPMPLQCAVCETVNADDALECAECGRQLLSDAEIDETIEPVPDVDRASYAGDTALTPDIDQLPELELTHYQPTRVIVSERMAVESTLQPAAGEVASEPVSPDFESGREADDGTRTLPPEEADLCPFCGVASAGKVCDGCGRRKARYTVPKGAPRTALRNEPAKEVCPTCLSRVIWAERCPECGVRMKPRE